MIVFKAVSTTFVFCDILDSNDNMKTALLWCLLKADSLSAKVGVRVGVES